MTSALFIAGWGHTASSGFALLQHLGCEGFATSVHALAAGHDPDMGDEVDYSYQLSQHIETLGGVDVLIGWSMGAMVALQYALKNEISNLVLIGGTARFCSNGTYTYGKSQAELRTLAKAYRAQPEGALKAFYEESYQPKSQELGVVDFKLKEAELMQPSILFSGFGYLDKTDLREEIKNISSQTLVIHGMKDDIIPWQASSFLEHRIPNSDGFFHRTAGHGIVEEEYEELATQIKRFLKI